MSEKRYFDEKLAKRGKAEEDLWFARRERELIEARRNQTNDPNAQQVDDNHGATPD